MADTNTTVWEAYYDDQGVKRWRQIHEMSDIITPTDEEVELMIKDDLDNKIAFDKGTKYIFGGNTGDGRWICVQGLKVWYQTDLNKLIKNNGTSAEPNWFYDSTNVNKFKDNLYWDFDIQGYGHNKTAISTLSFKGKAYSGTYNPGSGNESWLYCEPTFSWVYTNDNILRNGFPINNLKYCGFLLVATEISQDLKVKLRIFPMGIDNSNSPQFLNMSYKYNNSGQAEGDLKRNSGGSNIDNYQLRYYYGAGTDHSPYPIEVTATISQFEYYYAMGLTDIYEEKGIQDVEDILNQNNSGGD